jgi:hypothetical protein
MYGQAKAQLHIFLIQTPDGHDWSASRPSQFNPSKGAPQYSLNSTSRYNLNGETFLPSIEHPDVTNNKTFTSIYEIIQWNEYALISHKTFQTLVDRF